ASENLVYIDRGTSRHLGNIHSIGHEATLLNEQMVLIDCGDPMRSGKIDDFPSMRERKGRRHHQDALVAIPHHPVERGGEFPRLVQYGAMKLDAEIPTRDSGLLIVLSAQLGDCRERDVLLKERDL